MTISLFIGLILFKPVAQFSWEIWYAVNQEYVAEELCENKEEPEMQCNGKCYLAKQLAKVENEKPEEPTQEKRDNPFQVKEEPAIDQELCCVIASTTTVTTEKPKFNYSHRPYTRAIDDIFHPPQQLI